MNDRIDRDRESRDCVHCREFVRPRSCRQGREVAMLCKRDCFVLKSDAWVERRHTLAVRELYRTAGVGRGVAERRAFWRGKNGDYYISHNPTPQQEVWICEDCWLFEQFPEDFVSC